MQIDRINTVYIHYGNQWYKMRADMSRLEVASIETTTDYSRKDPLTGSYGQSRNFLTGSYGQKSFIDEVSYSPCICIIYIYMYAEMS
jgi:hypothetical protein